MRSGCGSLGTLGDARPAGMWTQENRPKYDRNKLRYPSDLTDEEWAIVGPLIPPAKRGGNKRTIDERAVLNGVMYILRDRKSTRLNSSHANISYAVFCLKKKTTPTS